MSTHSFRLLTLIIAIVMILGIFSLAGSKDAYAADEYPAPEDVCIDTDPQNPGSWHFTKTNLYYNCDTEEFVSTKPTNGHYAYYYPTTGTLYLYNYNRRAIGVNGDTGKKLTIYLFGNNDVFSDRQFVIYAPGQQVEITSKEENASLSIKDHYYWADGDGAAITNSWGESYNQDIIISGTAKVNIDYSAGGRAFGVWTHGNFIIKDSAEVDINAKYGQYANSWSAAAKVDGTLKIDTSGRVNFTSAARDLWKSGQTGYAAYIGGSFNLLKGAEYVSMSSVGSAPKIFNKTVSKLDFSSSGYYDSEEKTKTTAVRFFRSDYYSPEAIPINGFFFPDPSFRDYVRSNFDYDGDGWAELSDIQCAETVYMDGDKSAYVTDIFDGIDDAYSIKGIEYFTNILDLIWENGFIQEIDISQNTKLLLLAVSNNCLTSLNTASNTALTELYCGMNKLTSLDLSKNTKLIDLGCRGNLLKKLNLKTLTNLTYLDCRNNSLKSLDVSANTKLSSLLCGNDLVIEEGVEWPMEFGSDNYNEIRSLDVSGCKELVYLECQRNDMLMLDLGANSNLRMLHCYGNSLEGLFISGCPKLVDIYKNGTKDSQPQYYVEYKKDSSNYIRMDGGDSVFTSGGTPAHYAAFNGASLSLKDKISVNIYLLIPDSVTGWKVKVCYEKDTFKTVQYTYDLKKTASYYSSSANEYKISFPDISAKELTHYVRVEVVDDKGNRVLILNGGGQSPFVNYSAADWANAMIADNSRPAKTVNLAKALLNFGGEAQKYFDYNTGNNANSMNYLTSEMSAVTANTLKAYAPVWDSNTTVVGQNGISLSLKSETYLNVYYTKDVTVSASGLNGAALKKVKSGDEWVARITGISAKNLGDQYTLTVKYGTTTSMQKYSALSWAYNVLSGSNAKPKQLAKALYLYQKAAVEYFK